MTTAAPQPPTSVDSTPGGSTGTVAPGSTSSARVCPAKASTLLGLLKVQKQLANFASTLKLSSVRCSDRWASGVITAKDTDSALALFQNDAGAWRVLIFGSSDTCAGQGISAAAQVVLHCADWP